MAMSFLIVKFVFSFFIAVLYVFGRDFKYSSVCEDGPIDKENYKGRYFENYSIDSNNYMLATTAMAVATCRYQCGQTIFCKAITYNKFSSGIANCKLYSINGLNKLLIADEAKDTIFLIPADFQFTISSYNKGTENVIDVGGKDDKPGTFVFQLPTGLYRIKLEHISGGLGNTNRIPFGFYLGGSYYPNRILLVKNFHGDVSIPHLSFSDYEGNGRTTTYLATTDFFPLVNGSTYSFWNVHDFYNRANGEVSGVTSFEMFVQIEH